ncbi:MAG: alpha/beta hydrolase [Chloroflexota bacterium]
MKTEYLKLKNGLIAYDDQGHGPLVLCVPAGGDLRSEYRFLTPQLVAAGYRVVTMDLRGQGESSADWPDYSPAAVGADILALMRHLKADSAIIIATSVATAAAIWASVEAPELVKGLVLISAAGRASSPALARLMPQIFLNAVWGNLAYKWYFPKMYPSSRPPDFEAHLRDVNRMLNEAGRLRALRLLFANSYKDWDDRVSQVTEPVLILNGSADPDFKAPEQEARVLAERMRSSQVTVRVLQGAGHHPQAEQPDLTAQSILDFLATRQSQAAFAQEAM